jgi:hypothetical protein
MQNPKTTAIISGIAAILLAFRIFGATETPSSAVATMQWLFFALAIVGLIGSLYRMSRN